MVIVQCIRGFVQIFFFPELGEAISSFNEARIFIIGPIIIIVYTSGFVDNALINDVKLIYSRSTKTHLNADRLFLGFDQ